MQPRHLLATLLLAATAPAYATLAFGVWAEGPQAINEAFGDTLSTPGWAGATRAGGQATYYDAGGVIIVTPGGTPAPNGAASVQPALANPCPGPFLCSNPSPVRAYGDISGQTGRFRGYATAEASLLNEHYAASAGATLLDTLSMTGGGLTLKLSLESVGTHLADEIAHYAGTSFNYNLMFTTNNPVPGCDIDESVGPCTLEVASFGFVSGFDHLAGANVWSWGLSNFFLGVFQGDNGTGSLVDLTLALSGLPTTLDLELNASVQSSCISTANGNCRATMDAFNSAYIELIGNYTSANGYQYLGRAAIPGDGGGNGDSVNAVPEPSSLGLLLAGFAVMGGVARQRRYAGSAAASM